MDDKNLENKDTGTEPEVQDNVTPADRERGNVNQKPEPNKEQQQQNGAYDYGQNRQNQGQDYGYGQQQNQGQDYAHGQQQNQGQDYGHGQQQNQGQNYGYGQQQNQGQNYNYGQYQTGQNPNYGTGGPQQYNNTYRPYSPMKSNSFALVALIMGIASLLLACCSGIGGVVLGALGIIFAIISRGKERMCTQAKIGLGVSIAGIVLGIIIFVASLLFIGSGEFQRMFEDEMHRRGFDYEYDYDYDDDYSDDFHFDGGSQHKNGLNGL